tara:strand:+ start:66 stop:443 length:378 start_codon:yes stop_codon:yes gene_type:complete
MRAFFLTLLLATAKGFFTIERKDCKISISYGEGYETVTDEFLNELNESDNLLIELNSHFDTLHYCKKSDKILKYANQLLKMKSSCGYEKWTYGNMISDSYQGTYVNINKIIALKREIKNEVCKKN